MSLLVEELFDYSAQNLSGLNGGTGWDAAWVVQGTGTEQSQIVANNLTYAGVSNGSPANNSMMVTNNEGSGSLSREFSRTHNAINNTVNGEIYWYAMTIASNLSKGGASFVLHGLTSDVAGTSDQVLFAWTSNLSDAKVQSPGPALLYTGSSSYVAHDIIIKVTMSGVAATLCPVSIFCDVDMNTNPALWTAKYTDSFYVKTAITGIIWDSQTAASSSADDLLKIDNIRWATTSYEAGGYSVPVTNTGNFFHFFRGGHR